MNDSQSGNPTLRSFQLDSDLIGDVGKSVNVYRGDITLPQKLLSLPGVNGLNLDITAVYSSNVSSQVDTWNVDAPTGVLGLGWQLPLTWIELVSSGTASWYENGYNLWVNGNAYSLIPVSAQTTDDDVVTFSCRNYPLWQFTYTAATETWNVIRDDGGVMNFGGVDSDQHTVQWGVRDQNWLVSVSAESEMVQYAIGWNLATQADRYGNTISYSYLTDEKVLDHASDVSDAQATYTRASYVDKAIAVDGKWVKFTYDEKQDNEYQAQHAGDGRAYPDRYETKYLSKLQVLPPSVAFDADDATISTAEYYSLVFDYEVKNLDLGDDNTSPTSKRYLTSLTRMRNSQPCQPATEFTYEMDSSALARGMITSLTYPAGGKATWEHETYELNSQDQTQFSMNYDVQAPEGYESATTRIWFGSDYAVVLWIDSDQGKAAITVYSYGGAWTSPWVGDDLTVPKSQNADDFILIPGGDFFAFYANRSATSGDDLHVYKRSQYDFGRWEETQLAIDTTLGSGESFDSSLSRMVLGADFIGLHIGGGLKLNLYAWDETTRTWSASQKSKQSASKISLAVSGDALFASYFAGDSGDSGKAYDVAYRFDFFNGDDGDAVTKDWTAAQDLATSKTFTWTPATLDSYWSVGAGFAAATYQDNDQNCNLNFYRWDYDNAQFMSSVTDSQLDFSYSFAADNVIANGGALYRATSAKASSDQFEKTLSYSPDNGDTILVGQDVVFIVKPSGSGYTCSGAAFVLNEEDATCEWVLLSDFPSNNISDAGPATPQLNGDWLTIGAYVYYRQPGTLWTDPVNAEPVTKLVTSGDDGRTASYVYNMAPSYITYQDSSDSDVKTYVCLIQNGGLLDPVTFDGTMQTDGAAGEILTGPTAFCTYPFLQGGDFGNMQSFTLHRVLNYSVQDVAETSAVGAVLIETGTETLRTQYDYDTATAIYDATGTVVQFPNTVAERVSSDGSVSLGRTETHFYNGVDPGDLDQQAILDEYGDTGVEDYYTLLNGYIRTVKEYSSDGDAPITTVKGWTDEADTGTLVSQTTKTWSPIVYTTAVDADSDNPGFALLAESVAVQQSSEQTENTNLQIVALGTDDSTADDTDGTGSVTIINNCEFNASDGQTRRKWMTFYNSLGQEETREIWFTQAWTVYDGMSSAGLFCDVAQKLSTVDDQPVQSFVQTYQNDWAETNAWALAESFAWPGDGEADYFSDDAEPDTWISQGGVLTRNAQGQALSTKDALGVVSSTVFDDSGIRKLASFTNADAGQAQAGYTGFADDDSTLGGWSASDGEISALYDADDAHTGQRCVKLDPSAVGLQATYQVNSDLGTWVVSAWVRTPSGGGDIDASFTITVAGQDPVVLPIPDSPDQWTHIYTYVPITSASSSAVTMTCEVSNNSGSRAVLLDDLMVAPAAAKIEAIVLDQSNFLPRAVLGPNGETTHVIYDRFLRPVAKGGVNGQMGSLSFSSFSRFISDTPIPNTKFKTRARSGGLIETFRNGTFAGWSSGDASAWEVAAGTLVHQNSGTDSITLDESSSFGRYAVRLTLSVGETNLSGPLGIMIGEVYTVQYAPADAQWQLLNNGTVVASSDADAPSQDVDLCIIASQEGLAFFNNEQLLISYVIGSEDPAVAGAFTLLASDPDIGFSNICFLLDPQCVLTYTDGCSRDMQIQKLERGDAILVNAALYDPVGRQTIQTKAMRYQAVGFGYQASLITGMDQSGRLSGELATYYNGDEGRSDDGGYPYHRKRYEWSNLNRVLEEGLPGADLAIGSDSGHTTTTTFAVNGASAFFGDLPQQTYAVTVKTNPDGYVRALVEDAVNNKIAALQGPTGLPTETSLPTALLRDNQDNITTLQPPNYFRPPAGSSAGDFQVENTYDSLNRRLSRTTSNSGLTQYIYDNMNRLRFELRSDGQNTDPNAQKIVYTKYDNLGRVSEKGWYEGAWDEAALSAYANQDYPTESTHPRSIKTYDVDDNAPYALGRQVQVQTIQADQSVITETFNYDIFGNTTQRTAASDDFADPGVAYSFDVLGNPVNLDYPATEQDEALQLRYGYDALGRLSTLGTSDDADAFAAYTYNAQSNLETETLGGGSLGDAAITRTKTYWSPDWINTIEDISQDQQLFSEQLHFYDQTAEAQPLYDGRLASLDSTWNQGDQAMTANWSYAYDDNLQLAQATCSGDDAANASWSFDANGNMTQSSDDDGEASYGYNSGTDQIVSVNQDSAYAYAQTGELTSNPTSTISYDFTTKLATSAQIGASATEVTLGLGDSPQRLRKTVSDATDGYSRTYTVGIKAQAVAETQVSADGNATTTRIIRGPGGIICQINNGVPAFVLHDHLNSSRLLVQSNTDQSGLDIVGTYAYMPFGSTLAEDAGSDPSSLRYRFTGQEWDDELGTYNFRARIYDPILQRFYARDSRAQFASPYIYTGNNPLMRSDPSGNFSLNWGEVAAAGMIVTGIGLNAMHGEAIGGPLVTAGSLDMQYSIKAKHFSWSKFGQVGAAAAISSLEIEAGISMSVIGTYYGNEYMIVAGGTMTDAGIYSLEDVSKQVNENPDAKFNWDEYGKEMGIGAAVGFVSSLIGLAAGGLAGSAVSDPVISGVVGGIVGGAAGGAAGNFTSTSLETWAHDGSPDWEQAGIDAVVGAAAGSIIGLFSAYASAWAGETLGNTDNSHKLAGMATTNVMSSAWSAFSKNLLS